MKPAHFLTFSDKYTTKDSLSGNLWKSHQKRQKKKIESNPEAPSKNVGTGQFGTISLKHYLLAPTGALIVTVVYYSITSAGHFLKFQAFLPIYFVFLFAN